MIQPRIKPSEERILTLLSEGGHNLRETAERLSMPLQTASARLSELHDSGLITQGEMRGTYHLTPLDNVGVVKYARDRQRYEKWKKLGEANNYFGKEYRDAMDLEFEKQN
jgi:predicted transcriptional regulator